jgi:hypothetical protein
MLPILCLYVLMAGGCKSSGESATANGIVNSPGWPKTFESDGQSVTVFQPQILDWTNQTELRFRAAVAVMEKGAKEPVYGVMNGTAQTLNEPESRTVYLYNLQMDIAFPGVDPAKSSELSSVVRDSLPSLEYMPESMDHVIASLKAGEKHPTVEVNLNPPPISYFDSPAILVIYNGKPDFKPIEGVQLNYAVNTNWDVLQDQKTSKYYLLNGDSWITSDDVMNGPWEPAKSLPDDFAKLPADENWDAARKHIPGKVADSAPHVVASTQPAEIIVTDGAPKLVSIEGTKLQYVSNPEMPLFYDTAESTYYYLVAGRWFSTRNLSAGDWQAASAQLPSDFGMIPPDGPMGYVLASVPGTPQAQDAVVLASIPHEATIDIANAKVDVTYIGDPQFIAIEGTSMTYAVNTSYQVIDFKDHYYCCYQGVWFDSSSANGPWVVCTSVPTEIYTIPPTCPVYNCTYVQVYSSTPSTVFVGYTAGYDGCYVASTGCVMFGAGFMLGALASPCFYPSYYSYGCCARYSYACGGFYRAGACYGPYGGAGYAAKYNPRTGTYSRSGYAYGAGGAAGYRQAYNPYTHTYASRAGGTNGYQSWGSSVVSHNGNWAAAGHVSGPNGTYRWAQTSNGKYATAGRGANGDVYGGVDGNVYRRDSDGQWQEHDNGSSGWSNVDKSNFNRDTGSQLGDDSWNRDRGNFNSDASGSYRSGGWDGSGGFDDHGGWGGGGGGFSRGGFGGFSGGGFRR